MHVCIMCYNVLDPVVNTLNSAIVTCHHNKTIWIQGHNFLAWLYTQAKPSLTPSLNHLEVNVVFIRVWDRIHEEIRGADAYVRGVDAYVRGVDA